MTLGTLATLHQDAKQARTNGWSADTLEFVTPPSRELVVDPTDRAAPRQKLVFASLQIKRTVRGELSRIYLRVMYEQAKQKKVSFLEIDETDPDYILPPEPQTLCGRFLTGDYRITPTEDVLLKRRYIHTSAGWNNPVTGKHAEGWSLLYFNSPTTDGIRVKHPHAVKAGL